MPEPNDTEPEDTEPEDTEPEDTEPEDTEPEDTEDDGHTAVRRRRRRRIALGVLAVVVVWLGFAALRMVSAVGHAQDGVDAMRHARSVATGDLAMFVDSVGDRESNQAKQLSRDLATATDSFSSAHGAVESPVIAPLKVVPLLGRQIRAISALSDATATTTGAAHATFQRLTEIAASAPSTPEQRLVAGKQTETALQDFSASVRGLDMGPRKGLIQPLVDAHNRVATENRRLTGTIDQALTAVTGVNRFMTGPSRYLVLAANNAEMRAGSGMFLQVGELTVDNGRFTLSDMEPTAKMVLQTPGTKLDPQISALWDWMYPDREWRAINATPRFDESSRMASDMWVASGHQPVDGVIAVDVVGLQKLLELVGPVDVTGPDGKVTSVTADNVLQQLLLKQYLDNKIDNKADNTERRDRLSDVAKAVFEAMNQRPFSPGRLLRTFQTAGRGRHLMIWSKNPVEQAAWEALDTAGKVSEDSLLLSVMNRGGNKLDQFLKVAGKLSWTDAGEVRHLSVRVDLDNATPAGLSRYVAGPSPALPELVAGEYKGVIALTVPRSAFRPTTEGAELFLGGEDGPTRVLTTKVDLRAGASTSVTFNFDVPKSQRRVVVEPSARVPRVRWTAGGETWVDHVPHVVDLTA